MKLSKKDCDNLIDTLIEWKQCVGVKEMDDCDAGLDDDRYQDLIKRLKQHTDSDCEIETFADFAIGLLSEKDIANWKTNNG